MSLAQDDVAFLDAYAAEHAFPSRSAVVQQAIHALRLKGLHDAYSAAWEEWSSGEDRDVWDATSGDGI